MEELSGAFLEQNAKRKVCSAIFIGELRANVIFSQPPVIPVSPHVIPAQAGIWFITYE